MPILKPTPFVTFDPHNREHVAAVWEADNITGTRKLRFNFDFPAPFTNGIAYAKHVIFLEWCKSMGVVTAPVEVPTDDKKVVAIGSKSAPLKNVASRGLPPGTELTPA